MVVSKSFSLQNASVSLDRYHGSEQDAFYRERQTWPEEKRETLGNFFFFFWSFKIFILYWGVLAKSLQLCLTLCDPMDCSHSGSSVHGILQQEYWSGLPCPPPGDFPDAGIDPMSLTSPALAGKFFTTFVTQEAPVLGL